MGMVRLPYPLKSGTFTGILTQSLMGGIWKMYALYLLAAFTTIVVCRYHHKRSRADLYRTMYQA
jgi:hypothetical protein